MVNRLSNSLTTYLDDIREARFVSKLHCAHCSSDNIKGHGKYSGRQLYKCKNCNNSFNDTTASP